MIRMPELVKRGWFFTPYWDAVRDVWHVRVLKRSWGIAGEAKHPDWTMAHELAADWAENEEQAINEYHDTDRAPPMVEGAAE